MFISLENLVKWCEEQNGWGELDARAELAAMRELYEAVKEDLALNPELGASVRVMHSIAAISKLSTPEPLS